MRRLLAGSALVLLAACAEFWLPDDRLRLVTGGTLGMPSSELTISDRRSVLGGSHYVATTRTGVRYRCYVPGGGAPVLGLVDKPRCQPE